MDKLKFNKSLYPKVALLKAAYNFTDRAYIHLDADENNYYVICIPKHTDDEICEFDFKNELLVQSVRHEIYVQTKDIRELLMARAMATSVVLNEEYSDKEEADNIEKTEEYNIEDIVKDWFANE